MNKHVLVHRGWVAWLVLAVAFLAGCSSSGSDGTSASSGDAGTRTYVGTAPGTAAFIAVVVDGSRALAYICDGVPADPMGTPPTIQAWFNGPSDGGDVDVKQAAGQLQLRLTDTDMTGALTLTDGRKVSVTGRAVTGDAGLYRAETAGSDGKAVAGWILAPDGQQRGGVGGVSDKISGTSLLNLAQPTFSFQGLATARIAKVGITPIPIP